MAMEVGRRNALKSLQLASAALFSGFPASNAAAAATAPGGGGTGIAARTAIQGTCAWPNCQILPDGTILALIFNQPCHGLWEGDLDCWASEDGGAAPPHTSRERTG